MQYILVMIYVVMGVSGMSLFKAGSNAMTTINASPEALRLTLSWSSILGVVLYGGSFLLYLYLISKFDLSYLMPILTGLTYIGILLVSSFIFKESMPLSKVIGSALILGGVIVMNLPHKT